MVGEESSEFTSISFLITSVNNTNTTTTTRSQTDSDMNLQHFYFVMSGVIGTFVCIIGLLGNSLNILILVTMAKRQSSSTTTFLLAMAVSDLLVLVIYLTYDLSCIAVPQKPLLSVADAQGLEGTFTYLVFYTWYFPANIFMTASNWCIVAVMAFRFIAVYFPLKASRLCSVGRAKFTVAVIAVTSIALVFPEFFTIQVEANETMGFKVSDTKLHYNLTFNALYYSLTETMNSFVPFTVCTLLSIALVKTLQRADNNLSRIASQYRQASTKKPRRNGEQQRKISIMLLGLASWFILCTCPSFACRIFKHYALKNSDLEQLWIKSRAVSDMFLLLNHTANFILYTATNNSYRRHFLDLLLCRDRKALNRRRTVEQSLTMKSMIRPSIKQSDEKNPGYIPIHESG